MDTNDPKQVNPTPPPSAAARPVQQPVTPPPTDKTPAPPPVAPSGSGSKEAGPTSSSSPLTETQEKPVEVSSEDIPVSSQPQEVPVSAELKEFGVDQGADAQTDVLSEELKQSGVEMAKESTPFPTGNTSQVTLPMTYDEVVLAEKKKMGFKDALKWFLKRLKFEWKRSNPELYK